MKLDAETRAALEWVIDAATIWTQQFNYAKDALELFAQHFARLQALLDGEKGGAFALSTGEAHESHRVSHVGAPPDSSAKIAADLRHLHPYGYMYSTYREQPYTNNDQIVARMIDDCCKIAARVEALGLEPSEREVSQDDAKPSLAERIEALADCSLPVDFLVREDLRAIAAELREIAAIRGNLEGK